MFRGFKKVFFLSISICYAIPVSAQFMEDIPLFEETSSEQKSLQSEQKDTPTSLVIPKSEEKKPEPNIGRKAIPLDKVVLTPDPLPEISINLKSDPHPAEETPTPTAPINTRQEGIYIPPADKTEVSAPQPSSFANHHDVRQFEIEGFYLGMTPKSVLQVAQQKRYQISKIKRDIPLFQTSYYDSLCRQSGIKAPEMIRACIYQQAQTNKQTYIKEIVLTKKPTHESFQFLFASPATDNEAYQITYHNRGDSSLNFTRPNLAKKLNRKETFFNAVFEMYGYPDDANELIWGVKEDAYMQVSMMGSAYDATIKLVDMHLSNEDYFAASDWKADQKPLYHFGFAE